MDFANDPLQRSVSFWLSGHWTVL